jgi:hypothetical protein
MRRALSIALLSVVVAAFAAGEMGCKHPYSGQAEKLKKPKKKKRKDKPLEEVEAVAEGPSEEPCRTNFFAEPPKRLRRKARDARQIAQSVNSTLLDAERLEGESRNTAVLAAMNKLRSALNKDPYGPEPTFKFAIAYALVGKKSCALAFLERLKLLQQFPDTEKEATRVVQRAARDPAFEAFRQEALTALGE